MKIYENIYFDICLICFMSEYSAFATFEGCWGVQHSDVLRGFRLDLAIPGGLRSAKLSALSKAAGGSSGVGGYADSY